MNTVVVIDDSEPDRYLASRAVRKAHQELKLIEYDTALEAVDDFLDSERFGARFGPHPPPTLVLLDINMPCMSGFEFLERLTESGISSTQCVVVMMLTSSDNPAERQRAKQFELVVDYLVKPLTPESLMAIVQRAEFAPKAEQAPSATDS